MQLPRSGTVQICRFTVRRRTRSERLRCNVGAYRGRGEGLLLLQRTFRNADAWRDVHAYEVSVFRSRAERYQWHARRTAIPVSPGPTAEGLLHEYSSRVLGWRPGSGAHAHDHRWKA